MFDRPKYVPILKGRDGEYGALQGLNSTAKDRLIPLIEMPPIPWNFEEERPDRTIDTHLEKVTQKLDRAWGSGRPFFLDFLWIAEEERMTDGGHPVNFVAESAASRGLCPIPVVGLVRG